MKRQVCIHAHFYQPPRENPWLEEIEVEDSAYPYHDWNERVNAECYAPNTASRILDPSLRIMNMVNNYSKISFNFGPTLLSWMKDHAPEVYQAVLEADKESQKVFSGHGSALAQAYNHMIMPLATSRDKRTQVIWGIKDFESRFGHKPEGMWLPETAVDLETLDLMAERGIKFTILAPHQAKRVRKINDKKWIDVSGARIDPKMPYLCVLPSGRTISIFFYDGFVAHDVAFGDLLKSGINYANRLTGLFSPDQSKYQLAHVATDGETYGHHWRFGDMALAYCIHYIETNKLADVTIYGEFLERNPPTHEVSIIENTSWSCSHGVERWKGDCGCSAGSKPGWNQKWRAPLRRAMDWLRDSLAPIYEREVSKYLKDAWKARDEYIEVILDRSVENIERFISRNALRELSKEEKVKVMKLMELQRHAMLMYTSCGWFFGDISGIETIQTMKYASRAMQLAKELSGTDLEPTFVKMLEQAPSNVKSIGNGANVYEIHVRPSVLDVPRIAAHYAVSSLFEDYPDNVKIYSYTVKCDQFERMQAGTKKLSLGSVILRSDITLEESCVCFAAMNFGGHNVFGGVHEYMGTHEFSELKQNIKKLFEKGDVTEMMTFMDGHFGVHNYSLWHLFKDEQRKVTNMIVDGALNYVETLFRQIYEQHYPVMHVMKEINVPPPKALAVPLEFTINMDLRRLLEKEDLDLVQIQELVNELKRWSFQPDRTTLSFLVSKRIDGLMDRFSRDPEDFSVLQKAENLLDIMGVLSLDLNLWKSQNVFFKVGKQKYVLMNEMARRGDENARKWVEQFDRLNNYLRVKVS